MNLPPEGRAGGFGVCYMYIKTDILMSSSRLIFVGDRCSTWYEFIYLDSFATFWEKKFPVSRILA